ncbi:hypothetical protein MMC22_011395 [Lobaria immixta]|nr:hypothetical protein [Lobaria immixta]
MATFQAKDPFPLEGGCDCKYVRYRMETQPLVVQCCHCRWCQRETGAAFGLNALIEHDRVTHLEAEPEFISTPSASGEGQLIARCPKCRIAVWSNYGGPVLPYGPNLRYIKVGTLDQPDHCPPNVHIFTTSKQPWVVLPEGMPASEELYEKNDVWSKESLERNEILLEKIKNMKTKNEEKD